MKPDIKHYPVWLRELIFPQLNFRGYCSRQDFIENERALRQVFDNQRKNPVCSVLSELTLETIRLKFKIYGSEEAHQQKFNLLQDKFLAVYDRITALEKEVMALKAANKKLRAKSHLSKKSAAKK